MPDFDPIAKVSQFLALWEPGVEAIEKAIDNWFRPDTKWENVGLAVTTGPEEAKAFLRGFREQLPMAGIRIETLNISSAGNIVLTERIDHLLAEDGTVLVPLRLMGVFELDGDGKVQAWRDYFDTAQFG